MRAWLLTAVVLAGCLHGPAPALDPKTTASADWRRHMSKGEYVLAAKAAWNGKLGPMWIGLTLERALDVVQNRSERYNKEIGDKDALKIELIKAYASAIEVACRYGPRFPESGKLLVDDVMAVYYMLNEEMLRYLLLDFHCPVDTDTRDGIIDAARKENLDERMLRYVREARWSQEKIVTLVEYIFKPTSECDRGLKVAAALHPPVEKVSMAIRTAKCEEGPFDPDAWRLSQNDAREHFEAAIHSENHDLAFALMKPAQLGEAGFNRFFQGMLKGHWEYRLVGFLKRHPDAYEKAMAYALSHDELRAVGHLAKTGDWVRKAVARAIELHRYEDATLIAETGCDEAFRKEGPVLAFKAALEAKDFPIARRLAKRNSALIDKADARKADDGYYAWLATQPLPSPEKRRYKKPVGPPLPKCPTDWETQRKNCRK